MSVCKFTRLEPSKVIHFESTKAVLFKLHKYTHQSEGASASVELAMAESRIHPFPPSFLPPTAVASDKYTPTCPYQVPSLKERDPVLHRQPFDWGMKF